AGGDTQRSDRGPDRLQQLDAELAQALDHDRRRHLIDALGARRVGPEQLGEGEMGRKLYILDGAAPVAVLAHQLPPPARGAGHRDTHGCTSRYLSALASA